MQPLDALSRELRTSCGFVFLHKFYCKPELQGEVDKPMQKNTRTIFVAEFLLFLTRLILFLNVDGGNLSILKIVIFKKNFFT